MPGPAQENMKESRLYTQVEGALLSPMYFVLFAVYPVFEFFANNVYQVDGWVFFRPLVFIIILVGVFFCSVWGFLRKDAHHPALATTIFAVFFYAYGNILGLLNQAGILLLPGQYPLAWLFLLLLTLAGFFFLTPWLDMKTIAPALNVMAIVLLLFPLARVIKYQVLAGEPFVLEVDHKMDIDSPADSPDIYYIILDGYTRSDVYQNFGFDNSQFIHDLEEMGFYVAKCGRSNYLNTALSLSSSLNMDYIDELSPRFSPDEVELMYVFKSLDENTARRMLEDAGYSTVAFASGFPWSEMRDATIYYQPEPSFLNEFDVMFLKLSAARMVDDLGIYNLDEITGARFRERTLLVLDTWDELAALPGPKFVFVHIMASHAPFVFDALGNPLAPDKAGETAYADASAFISKALIPRLQQLIRESPNPPVIVLQGDHGPWTANNSWRLSILNAYYLPGIDHGLLYPDISPVNTFRVVFNSYFGTDYPLLEDKSYRMELPYLYRFVEEQVACGN